MKTIKVMSIVGIVLSAISYMYISMFTNEVDWLAAIGWGVIATFYLLGFSITALVISIKNLKK